MAGIAEQQDGLIDRYLNNRLDEADKTAFEIAMLEDEQLFARVQLLDAFKEALVDERAALKVPREQSDMPFRSWLQQPMSLLASVLVLGLGLQVGIEALNSEAPAPSARAIGSVLLVESTRGASRIAFSGEPPYLFQIDAGPGAANTTAAVTLRDADDAELLHVDALRVDSNGWARVVVDQALAGNYTLELVPAANATIRSFEITVSD